ncbi:class I SAM-dependent methyltransferase [Leptospira noguchii]|uniref:class I SAM-dependent methyltransferase n=1 Tax=Leptospira noguchii TaxID=28182 RepID=UPI001F061A0C|nr:class I SAM-dependent methyltransferase [Leptospira noguchii]MCH1913346.1 class I SAM-dependent methyltransferase [Leptospira noguchii]MCH1915393.1 class I SAM-dependent methyltransferase [Leptospira noguchii]UOG65243.1 class I SAM-dependent methyltransferase [Leptospira noguchii]
MQTEFSESQFKQIFPETKKFHYWDLARNFIIKRFLNKKETGFVLEIGCGTGIVVDYLSRSGYKITGVELGNSQVISEVKSKILINTDFINLSRSISNQINTILLLDVLEHIKDPKIFLDNIKNNFKNLKQIVITLPARKELWTNYDVYFGHYSRYDKKNALDLLSSIKEKEYKVEYSYFFHLLYIPIFLSKFKKSQRSTETRAINSFFIRGMHRLLSWVFILDYFFLPRNLPGSSIILSVKF